MSHVVTRAAPTRPDWYVAHQLILDSLPRRAEFAAALSQRGDGSSPQGVFAAIGAIRSALHARLGDRVDGANAGGDAPWIPELGALSSFQDRLTALQLVLEHFPQRGHWDRALSRRADGSTVPGVMAALADVRRDMHAYLGDLQEQRS